jgi:uncharacterized protein (DUF2237 family)
MTTRYDPEARNVLGGELKPCALDPGLQPRRR